jgi:hypothetical protein
VSASGGAQEFAVHLAATAWAAPQLRVILGMWGSNSSRKASEFCGAVNVDCWCPHRLNMIGFAIEAAPPSILFRVARAPDAKSFHHVEQSSTFQAKPFGRATRTTEPPVGALARGADFLANGVLQRGVRSLE